jgi:hypothetical protein
MNDDIVINSGAVTGSITMADGTYGVVTSNGISPLTMNTASTISIRQPFDIEDFLDEHIMNRVTVSHKVQEQELMKLKEVAPDYATEIKENIAKNCARDMTKKLTFTKKHDKDADVHHFIGRVWMFTEDELKNLINEARNV